MTKSNKLLQAKDLAGLSDAEALTRLQHDARLAHEMLPVIKQLAHKLNTATYWAHEFKFQMSGYTISDEIAEAIKGFNEAIAAAAPFLQED